MNWRFDELRISHKTLRALEMLRCLHLWSLSNLLRIASVLREPSTTLRCCPHWLYRVTFCGASKTYQVKCEQHWPRVTTSRSHTSNIVLARLAERVWYPKFQFSLLNTYFRLSGSQAHSYLFTTAKGRIVSCSHYTCILKYDTKPIWYVTLHLRDRRGSARHSFARSSQKRLRYNRSCVSTEALFSMIFVATQKLSSTVWTQP